MALIMFDKVTKAYTIGEVEQLAVNEASFTIEEGEFVVVLGPSGAGKTTVLNLLGGMDSVTGGNIYVNGENIVGYGDDALSDYRAANVGFVFQFYNLIPTLTAQENVALVKSVVKDPLDAGEILRLVGMEAHKDKFPSQLSGGEQQRVSIARAVAKNPTMLLCDEPTGALDSATGAVVLGVLQSLSRERGKTVIIVTHNALLAETADKVIRIKNGKTDSVTSNEAPLAVSEVSW